MLVSHLTLLSYLYGSIAYQKYSRAQRVHMYVLSYVFSLSQKLSPTALLHTTMLPALLFLGLVASTKANPRDQFEKFKVQTNKSYASIDEEELRFEVFQENLKKIAKHNSEGHTWTMGVTKFADLTRFKLCRYYYRQKNGSHLP